MYKLAALTCVAIGVFAMGIMHLSDKQILSLTPTSIDFQSRNVTGTLLVKNVKQKEIWGSLKITNGSSVPIRLDFSEFLIKVGKLSGSMFIVPSFAHYSKSQCEPIMELGYDDPDRPNTAAPSAKDDFLLIEPGLALDLEIKVHFNQEIKSGNLKITYPFSRINWLTDSIT